MEQWEKEYLEIIQRKHQSECAEQHQTDRQEEYIHAYWDEVIQPDGSKYYIPKRKKFHKHEKWHQRKHILVGTIGRVIRIGFLVCILFVFFSAVSKYASQIDLNFGDGVGMRPEFLHSVGIRNTMVDGLGMRDMLDTLFDISDAHTDTLNLYVASGYSFSDDELKSWMDRIDADLIVIGRLPHDDSYSEVVDSYILLLNTLKAYVMYSREGNLVLAQAVYAEYSTLLQELMWNLAKAFDRNGVQYTWEEGKIIYTYYQY